jgi:hypothetical protein
LRHCCSSPVGFCQSAQRCSLFSRSPSIERLSGSSLRTNGRVILDTNQLTVKPSVIMYSPAVQLSIPPPSDKAPAQSNLEAMALFKPDTQPTTINHSTRQIKRGVSRTGRSRRVAKGPVTNRRTEMGGGCCRFGWVDSGQSSSRAMPPRRAASSWPLD